MNANDIKAFLRKRGIKLAGIAPVSRLENVPDGRSPEKILPGAKSVIAFGLPMSVGAVQAKFRALEDGLEEGLPSGDETLGESRQRNKPRG